MFFMKSTTLLALLAVFIGIALASPATLDRRATNLELVLRETHKNTDAWHFALVIRPQGTTAAATKLEHTIDLDNMGMRYDDSNKATVKSSQAAVSALLVASRGEKTNEQLSAAIQAIAKAVPAATRGQINNGDFNNCVSFATETARRLGTAGYLSKTDAAKFMNYYNQWSAIVKAKTDAGVQEYCAQGTSGNGCAYSKTPSEPITKPLSKPAAGKKIARSESDVLVERDE